MRHLHVLGLCGVLLVSSFSSSFGAEAPWPDGTVIAEGSTSPDGRFGVLLPTREAAVEGLDQIDNDLVDLKSHRTVATIRGAHYFPGANHHDLSVTWAEDSSWCVVQYGERYGFGAITAVEIHGTKCNQTDLGTHIQKALDAMTTKQARTPSNCYGIAYVRPGTRGKIPISATGYTNPKAFPEVPAYHSLFRGTYDLAAKKWTRSEQRILDSDQFDALDNSYRGEGNQESVFPTQQQHLDALDGKLNEVYRALRIVLPPARFTAVKKEQLAWLKEFEAAASITEKIQLMAARVRELRDLLWD